MNVDHRLVGAGLTTLRWYILTQNRAVSRSCTVIYEEGMAVEEVQEVTHCGCYQWGHCGWQKI